MMPSAYDKTVSLLSLDFANIDAMRAAVLVAQRPDDAPFGHVVMPNADHLVRSDRRPDPQTIYRDA